MIGDPTTVSVAVLITETVFGSLPTYTRVPSGATATLIGDVKAESVIVETVKVAVLFTDTVPPPCHRSGWQRRPYYHPV